jgi:hypothetical protein
MPRRTNTFQQVIKLVYELMADDDATVEESAMLPDCDTEGEREVDVLVTGQIAGVPMRIQIEATARAAPVDVKWVEAELEKHRAVRANQLILVSEAGFSKDAKTKAEVNNAIPIEPRDLGSEDAVGEVVNRLGSIWPKILSLTPTHISGIVQRPNGERAHATGLDLDTLIVTETGEELGTISDEIRRRLDARFPEVAEEIGLADIAGDVEAYFEAGMPNFVGTRDGEPFSACMRWQPDPSKEPEFHRIIEIRLKGKAAIAVSEIKLTHKKLGEFAISYGTGKIDGKDALFVATENEDGGKGTVRFADVEV